MPITITRARVSARPSLLGRARDFLSSARSFLSAAFKLRLPPHALLIAGLTLLSGCGEGRNITQRFFCGIDDSYCPPAEVTDTPRISAADAGLPRDIIVADPREIVEVPDVRQIPLDVPIIAEVPDISRDITVAAEVTPVRDASLAPPDIPRVRDVPLQPEDIEPPMLAGVNGIRYASCSESGWCNFKFEGSIPEGEEVDYELPGDSGVNILGSPQISGDRTGFRVRINFSEGSRRVIFLVGDRPFEVEIP